MPADVRPGQKVHCFGTPGTETKGDLLPPPGAERGAAFPEGTADHQLAWWAAVDSNHLPPR